MYKFLLDVIDEVKNESSSNKKIEILTKYKDDKVLQYSLYLAYNPYIQFFIKKIPEYIPNETFQSAPLHSTLKKLESVLASRKKTGKKAALFLEGLLEGVIKEDALIIEKVIARNFDCGVSVKTINKVWPGLIPTFDVMLCSDFERSRVEYPCIAQEKLDGMRALLFSESNKKYSFRTRKGLPIDDLSNFQELRDSLPEGIIMDGELLVLNESGELLDRKRGNGILNKAIKGTISEKEAARIVFVVWDFITDEIFQGKKEPSLTTEDRFTQLKKFLTDNKFINVRLVEHTTLNSEDEILSLFTEFTSRGSEGLIVKNSNQVWEPKRSKGWMKMKMEQEMELAVDEVVAGLGKHQGRLGSLKCKDASGKLNVGIGGGFSDEEREDLWAEKNDLIGSIITVRYNEIVTDSSGGISLFLPRFIERRLDKSTADNIFEMV